MPSARENEDCEVGVALGIKRPVVDDSDWRISSSRVTLSQRVASAPATTVLGVALDDCMVRVW